MDVWNSASVQKLSFQLKIVPFEDTSTSAAFSNIGKKYDLMIGPHNSINIAKFSGFLELGQARFCLAMPRSHPLSGKKSVSYKDLHRERFFMQAKGNSPVNDKIRAAIEQGHPEITIVDLPYHYDLEKAQQTHYNKKIEETFTRQPGREGIPLPVPVYRTSHIPLSPLSGKSSLHSWALCI